MLIFGHDNNYTKIYRIHVPGKECKAGLGMLNMYASMRPHPGFYSYGISCINLFPEPQETSRFSTNVGPVLAQWCPTEFV